MSDKKVNTAPQPVKLSNKEFIEREKNWIKTKIEEKRKQIAFLEGQLDAYIDIQDDILSHENNKKKGVTNESTVRKKKKTK